VAQDLSLLLAQLDWGLPYRWLHILAPYRSFMLPFLLVIITALISFHPDLWWLISGLVSSTGEEPGTQERKMHQSMSPKGPPVVASRRAAKP